VKPHFQHAVIVGAGLLGGSLALAMKQHGIAARVTGVGRNQATLDRAIALGVIDNGSLDLAAPCKSADLVVIATPAEKAEELAALLPAIIPPSCIATDVTSTKARICAAAATAWPQPRAFVGSHPMAGSEKFGPENARACLFKDTVCLMEAASAAIDGTAHARIAALWQAVGARVVEVAPEAHDDILASTSHLPHVAAAALAQLADAHGEIADFVGNGFRDTTRIAEGRADVWRDIVLSNASSICAVSARLRARLEQLEAAMAAGDGDALEQFFEAGRAARQRAVGPPSTCHTDQDQS